MRKETFEIADLIDRFQERTDTTFKNLEMVCFTRMFYTYNSVLHMK